MKMKLKILIILLFTGLSAWSQVKFDATVSKKKLGVNERLRVDFEMNKDGDNFRPPSFQGFIVVGGPNQSISRQWVNGKSSFSKVYTYFLAPKTQGKITIGQAEITIDGEQYKTLPLDVEVTGAVNNPNDADSPTSSVADNVHLVAEVSDRNPYLNEAITVVYKLYVSRQTAVNGWNEIDAPKFANFWSQSIDEKQFKVYDGKYNGEPYRYVILRRTVLYPQKTGELKIEPLALNINVEEPTNKRDIFGGRVTRPAQITVTAKDQTVNVKELPSENKPQSFTGAVGEFNFDVSTSKKSLQATEALDLTVQVEGKGNLKLFNLPKLNLPNSLEVYEPQNEDNIRTNLQGMYGKKVSRYTVVPQKKGKYPIPPIEFSYFNPKTEQYETTSSQELIIDVEGGPAIASTPSGQDTTKQPVVSGDQFNYIKSDANLQPIEKDKFFKSTTFWALAVGPLLLLPVVLFLGRKRKAYLNDVKGNRIRKADKLSRKYLGEAKKNLGDQKSFYLALEKSLHNYLKAKLNIQTSDMSKERISSLLQERGVEDAVATNFIGLLESCEFARYTPASTVAMQQDFDKASTTISQLDKQL